LTERYYNPYVSLIYIACDACSLPLQDESVDCVTSWGGYENMGPDYDKGLEESYRVLKNGGATVHISSTCDDSSSDLVNRWVQLLKKEGIYKMTRSLIRDRRMWEERNRIIGFSDFKYQKIKDEIPPPETDTFPYKNEIMQWMGTAVITSTK
jgi:ubiquinone/menaquinone biosynthesis C-methylase UbiE